MAVKSVRAVTDDIRGQRSQERKEERERCYLPRAENRGFPRNWMKIAIVNGPNLGILGRRQPQIYGNRTWADVFSDLQQQFPGCELTDFQSNHEGAVIDFIEALAEDGTHGLVINPGAWTHQSYALRDAMAALLMPVVEVHISNIYDREDFRSRSLTAPAATGQISGLGVDGYRLAVSFICGS